MDSDTCEQSVFYVQDLHMEANVQLNYYIYGSWNEWTTPHDILYDAEHGYYFAMKLQELLTNTVYHFKLKHKHENKWMLLERFPTAFDSTGNQNNVFIIYEQDQLTPPPPWLDDHHLTRGLMTK